MVDMTTFLMRWLYLCNLVRDRAEIQSLPYTPLTHQHHQPTHHPLPYPPPPLDHHLSSFDSGTPQFGHTFPAGTVPVETEEYPHPHRKNVEEEWRDQCLRGLLSYPPGTQRLLAMDALRVELVQKLAQQLSMSDQTLQQFAAACRKQNQMPSGAPQGEDDDDPYLDADVEIVRAFGQATTMEEDVLHELGGDEGNGEDEEEAVLVISGNGTDLVKSSHDGTEPPRSSEKDEEVTNFPTAMQAEEAHQLLVELRDYLPQLVSAVLHSPPALTQVQGLDPIQKLRQLILTRCLKDASWGIDLCWLLEAEVGRAWKTLFEHRQQTGKRLIVVLPAERAAALAKIGMEKRGAFNLLQDTEQATAYGFMLPSMDPTALNDRGAPPPPRLPSSLSLRRCSHFGDTMHFIDRLTEISLDLRMVPNLQRHAYLEQALCEMNRRLRRRMITRGDVSLDVEDNRGPYDWPEVSDLTVDLLKYSVHFPLEPMTGSWPGDDKGEGLGSAAERARSGVMRVLNIVSSESRILPSRERCPFLVHLEVAETGLDGSDARLYACGGRDLGTTIEEALGLGSGASAALSASRRHHSDGGFPGCRIPPELLAKPISKKRRDSSIIDGYGPTSSENESDDDPNPNSASESGRNTLRGGWQSEEEGAFYPSEGAEYMYTNPYDMVRQQQYEQLHQQMQFQQRAAPVPQELPLSTVQRPLLTTKSALLEKVFGLPWAEKCEQIRQTSPYGNVDGWRLATFIMKAGEDIRREALVMQVIAKLSSFFQSDIPESHRPYLRPYRIMCVGGDAGLLECVNDAKSIDEVKKRTDGFVSLREYFERAYGPPSRIVRLSEMQRPVTNPTPSDQPYHQAHSPTNAPVRPAVGHISFEKAQDNFLRSLVGYSLVCYILQIKDRHNANILLNRDGHIMHIDFGFVLGDTPKMGKVPIFSERAPFKLSAEFWEVLGGWNFREGGLGVRFCKMFEIAFCCAAAHADEIASLVEAAVLNLTRDPDEARLIANGVRTRLGMRGPADSVEQKSFVMELVNAALTSWGTSTYDWLQKSMNGYQ